MDAKTLGEQPAYPTPTEADGYWIGEPRKGGQFIPYGLTLRQHFAGLAMQAMIARGYDLSMRGYEGWQEQFALEADQFAMYQLAQLAKDTP